MSEILGKRVDLRTAEDLSRYFRQEVVDSAVMLYEKELRERQRAIAAYARGGTAR